MRWDNFSFKNEACNEYIVGLQNYQTELENYNQAYTQYIEDVKNSDMTNQEIEYTLKMINEERKTINAELQAQQTQIKEEIKAYKSLLPDGKELVATVMVEIDNPLKRSEVLSKMGGFEESFTIKTGEKVVYGKAELDTDRTTADGKASSVQFVHFKFSDEHIKIFKDKNSKIELGISSGSKTVIVKGINPGDRVFIDLPPWAKRKRD